MDIHRCRFVPYQPSAVNVVAFSHPYTKSSKQASCARMAVGRANGNIEIWNPLNGMWQQELVLRGGKDRSVDGLVWINEPDQDLGQGRLLLGRSRLFSIGYTSTITEWDLARGKPKTHAQGSHGDIWCIAAQPLGEPDHQHTNGAAVETQPSNKLVAGTIDGELVMYTVEDDDLQFQRFLVRSPTKKSQMVSITFQTRKIVIVGCSDSTIRAFDITKGQSLRRMTLGSDLAGGSKNIIVWSVKCLPDGNIVSGDSTGQLCVWDGNTYTQLQRIQSHKQDVLSVTISADGRSIMSGGMDRRTFFYKPTSTGSQRWSKVWGRRYHDHDVKTMAAFEHGRTSVVVSGGPDSSLVVLPLREMGGENHRTLGHLPQRPPIMSAPKARFVVSWWDREIHIWLLRKRAGEIFNGATEKDFDLKQNRKLLKTIVVTGDSNIASATINPEGTLLVVSTTTDVKAFHLTHMDPINPSDVEISTVNLPRRLSKLGASHVCLSPDGRWLLIVQEGSITLMVKVTGLSSTETATRYEFMVQRLRRLQRNVPRHVLNGGLGAYDRNITQVDFSSDSKMVVTADLAGYIDTWILISGDDQAMQRSEETDDASSSSDADSADEGDAAIPLATEQWIRNPAGRLLPKLASSPVVLSFSRHGPQLPGIDGGEDAARAQQDGYTLLTITSSWQLCLFNARQGSLTDWSRRHASIHLLKPVQDLLDLASGVLWQGPRMWIYGVSFLLMLDTSQDLPRAGAGDRARNKALNGKHGTKRKRNTPGSGAGGKSVHGQLRPHQARKHVSGDHWEDVDTANALQEGEHTGDEDMDNDGGELSELRDRTAAEEVEVTETHQQRRSWWISYKYRPIFGMVPLGEADGSLEVALVERPMWDMDLPERYYAGEPWER